MNNAINEINALAPPGITGEGIGIAILDTGICPLEDFTFPKNRIIAFKDFVYGRNTAYDDNGHGTHVAGIACGNGYLSHNKYVGIAPQSNIISLKILDELGHGSSSAALDAIRWIGKNKDTYNIRVVNLSIGTNDKTIASPLIKEVNSLWEKGVVVVAASGNDERNGIASPGISQKILTVGSIEEQIRFRIKSGNTVYYKPDVFAPGENIISCKADEFSFQGKKRSGKSVIDSYYVRMSGTSMATPMISGTAALILQYSPKLSPDSVKRLICNAANSSPPEGLLNIEKIFFG